MTKVRIVVGVVLVVMLAAASVIVALVSSDHHRLQVTAYFPSTNGLYPGDQVRILGVPVGQVETITPVPADLRVKVTFWVDRKYTVPADSQAAVLSPGVVSARVIQLVPPYTGGKTMADNAVIPIERTVVPVEWDELRKQLGKLVDASQPVTPGGTSPLGSFINTAADNLRGQGTNIRQSLLELSQTLSALGDHSDDVFSTVQHLSTLVSALKSSSEVLAQLNTNFADISGLLTNQPNEAGAALSSLATAITDVNGFIADNRGAVGTTTEKLSSITSAITASLGDVKQALHVTPNALANFQNMYRPASGGITGVFNLPNFANPLQFICSAIQAASRENYEQSAKLCVQYMAPIFKNRQYNFPPIGTNMGLANGIPLATASARPNEITYSEDRLRPDYNYRPGVSDAPAQPPPSSQPGSPPDGFAAEAPGNAGPPATGPVATDPAAGLTGLMVPPVGGGQ